MSTSPISRGLTRVSLVLAAALVTLGGATLLWRGSASAEPAVVIPPPAAEAASPADSQLQTAVLAGGCFWGVQAVFQHTTGVRGALSGYAGGMRLNPSYEQVSTGQTGHAESVQIEFDPRQISYGKILQIFFSVAHDPTQLNRQGPDSGTQYRSAIFYTDDTQKKIADAYIAQLDGAAVFKHPIVTQVAKLVQFFPAEAYHQDYALNHPNNPYIAINDLPKVDNLKRLFPDIYRQDPVTVAANAATR